MACLSLSFTIDPSYNSWLAGRFPFLHRFSALPCRASPGGVEPRLVPCRALLAQGIVGGAHGQTAPAADVERCHGRSWEVTVHNRVTLDAMGWHGFPHSVWVNCLDLYGDDNVSIFFFGGLNVEESFLLLIVQILAALAPGMRISLRCVAKYVATFPATIHCLVPPSKMWLNRRRSRARSPQKCSNPVTEYHSCRSDFSSVTSAGPSCLVGWTSINYTTYHELWYVKCVRELVGNRARYSCWWNPHEIHLNP